MSKMIIKPIIYKDAWHKKLASMMINIIYEEIFKSLLDVVDDPLTDIHKNAKPTKLEIALREGTVQFQGGTFRGNINAAISKEIKSLGGKWVKGFWRLASPQLPGHLQNAIYSNQKKMAEFDRKFNELTSNMPLAISKRIEDMSIEALGLENINRVSKEFKQTVGQAYSVMPDIGKEGKETLKQEYFDSENLPIRKKPLREFEDRSKAYLENFSQDEVSTLRRKIGDLIADGRSRHEIRNLIENRLKISADRCKFIARQETSLLTSNFKEIQYKQAGINKYIWRTVGDNRVREGHEDLNGKTFSFDNPPPASHFNTGEPCNPGEDYNCRCVALPVIEW